MVTPVGADVFKLSDGQTVTGEPISFDAQGVVLRFSEGKYSEKISWTKFSQEDLKQLAENPRATSFAEPFIEVTFEEKLKAREEAIEIKPVAGKFERVPARSLVGGMFSSSLGLVLLLVMYGGNLYSAYEIALFRAQSPALVCGVAAVLPLIGPIIFLSMPTQLRKQGPSWDIPAEEHPAGETVAAPVEAHAGGNPGLAIAQPAPVHQDQATRPETLTFPRGQFTFNRRFFETKFANFFGVVRRDSEKDMILVIKAARGEHTAQRITRISANEVHLSVQKGAASAEVSVPFMEIQEIQYKHKDA